MGIEIAGRRYIKSYITDVGWERNPANDSIATIVGYRIYRKRSEEAATAYRLIEEVDAGIYAYRDYDVGGIGLYTYGASGFSMGID